ncbi:MAG: hypothetical protein FJ286_11805 [Planctomycetes bacterium]|nr:hypothetical protein [Planctomycetota bacterium]
MCFPRTVGEVTTGRRRFLMAAVLVAAIPVTGGCGKKDPFGRQPLEGTITWEGKPIAMGAIALEPAEGQPAGANASIDNGKFSMPRETGPCPGKYNVWIRAFENAGADPSTRETRQILPRKFLDAPPASVTIEQVSDDKPNVLTIDLK